jgi:hypothetical protein
LGELFIFFGLTILNSICSSNEERSGRKSRKSILTQQSGLFRKAMMLFIIAPLLFLSIDAAVPAKLVSSGTGKATFYGESSDESVSHPFNLLLGRNVQPL